MPPTALERLNEDEAFVQQLNSLLVSTFHSIERYEERSLQSFDGMGLSVNEAHVVEAVGTCATDYRCGVSVSGIAAAMGVRVPTATAAVNRLVSKGILTKERSADDGRSINVRLTQAGRRAFRLHALFHRRMVDAVAGGLTIEERNALARGIRKLQIFFESAANPAVDTSRVSCADADTEESTSRNNALTPAPTPIEQKA